MPRQYFDAGVLHKLPHVRDFDVGFGGAAVLLRRISLTPALPIYLAVRGRQVIAPSLHHDSSGMWSQDRPDPHELLTTGLPAAML